MHCKSQQHRATCRVSAQDSRFWQAAPCTLAFVVARPFVHALATNRCSHLPALYAVVLRGLGQWVCARAPYGRFILAPLPLLPPQPLQQIGALHRPFCVPQARAHWSAARCACQTEWPVSAVQRAPAGKQHRSAGQPYDAAAQRYTPAALGCGQQAAAAACRLPLQAGGDRRPARTLLERRCALAGWH